MSGFFWLFCAGALIGVILTGAVLQAKKEAPGVELDHQKYLEQVRAAQSLDRDLKSERDELMRSIDTVRSSALAGNVTGRKILARLNSLEAAAAASAVQGDGITVTLADPAVKSDLSDGTKNKVGATPFAILDRDIQLVVNAMWASGAEAVAIDGVRVGPQVTIRQAGGALLVDNQPISSPYTVEAIGPVGALQTGFVASSAYLRMSLVKQAYGAGFTIDEAKGMLLSSASLRETRFARELRQEVPR
ncbi:MAG: DUF881 domain-containing protein [Mycobacteriaceae bacterium]